MEIAVRGVVPAEEVADEFARADVLLFVRGAITLQRGSAIAGVACGLPIVGYRVGGSGDALDEAGIEWSPWRDRQSLGPGAGARVERLGAVDGTARAQPAGPARSFFLDANRRAVSGGHYRNDAAPASSALGRLASGAICVAAFSSACERSATREPGGVLQLCRGRSRRSIAISALR